MVVTLQTNLFRLVLPLVLIALISACTGDDNSEVQPVAAPPPERATVAETVPAAGDTREDQAAQAETVEPRAAVQLQGADALIPLRDFLLESKGSAEVPPELRQALLEVLLSLGLPEVETVALQLLANGPAASEVVDLGLYLEGIEPGKYSDAVLLAAERALIAADPDTMLPAEFFQLLGELGNEQTALLLAEMPWYHAAYASIALAAIPDGSGIATLEQDAADAFAAGRDDIRGRVAIQLLAQLGPQFPEAAAALIKFAKQGVIPPDIWANVLDIVAGNQELTLLAPMPGEEVWSHTFYHRVGNQVIYGAARHPNLVDDGLDAQRLDLLDQLQPLVPPGLGMGG